MSQCGCYKMLGNDSQQYIETWRIKDQLGRVFDEFRASSDKTRYSWDAYSDYIHATYGIFYIINNRDPVIPLTSSNLSKTPCVRIDDPEKFAVFLLKYSS